MPTTPRDGCVLGSHYLARYKEDLITLATGHYTGTANTTLTQWKRRRKLLLLAPQYIAVDPLSVIFSMIVDCCLALFC